MFPRQVERTTFPTCNLINKFTKLWLTSTRGGNGRDLGSERESDATISGNRLPLRCRGSALEMTRLVCCKPSAAPHSLGRHVSIRRCTNESTALKRKSGVQVSRWCYISPPMDVGVNQKASMRTQYQQSGAWNLCNSKSDVRSNDWLLTEAFRRKWLDSTKRHAITAAFMSQCFESVVGSPRRRAGSLNSSSGSPRHPTLASSSRDAIKPWLTRIAA